MRGFFARFTKPAEHRMPGTVTHVPGVFYRYDCKGDAGHLRIFGRKLLVHWWNRTSPEWALHRAWYFLGIFTVIHTERGEDLKRCRPAGWRVQFAKIGFERIHSGFGIYFRKAEKSFG